MTEGGSLFSLDGKVAVVTGGAKGIGRFYSEALLNAGAKVVAADIDPAAVKAAGAELDKLCPERVLAIEMDVTDTPSIRSMVRAVDERWGRLDILVNNAAFFSAIPTRPSPWEIPDEEWDRVMMVNTRGIFSCTREALPLMRRGGGGRVINVASGLAFKGSPYLMHYAASKGAVVNMTRSMAAALGDAGITVNAIAPGGTASPTLLAARPNFNANATVQTRILKRVEVPEDLLGTLIYLASPASEFITGQTIVVDGGSYLH